MNNSIWKWAKDAEHLTKEDQHMVNKHMKRCSISYVIRTMQIKTMKFYYTTLRIAKIQKTDNAGLHVAQQEFFLITECEICSHFGKKFGGFLQN